MEKMTNVQAIRAYFGSPGYPTVSMNELKSLSMEEREELGAGAAKMLGVEIIKA
jgi:hypothetical protein